MPNQNILSKRKCSHASLSSCPGLIFQSCLPVGAWNAYNDFPVPAYNTLPTAANPSSKGGSIPVLKFFPQTNVPFSASIAYKFPYTSWAKPILQKQLYCYVPNHELNIANEWFHSEHLYTQRMLFPTYYHPQRP